MKQFIHRHTNGSDFYYEEDGYNSYISRYYAHRLCGSLKIIDIKIYPIYISGYKAAYKKIEKCLIKMGKIKENE